MRVTSCRLECTAFRAEDEPRARKPGVVFLGRSNVGKSSLINRLLGVKGLARTSSQPGRTQSVNFYGVNESCHFVDLPGYGYARVPEAVRRAWRPMVEAFLDRHRRGIALALLVVDARHRPSRLDLTMRDWLESMTIPYVVAATKADKLSGNGRSQAAARLAEAFGGSPRCAAVLVSASTGRGIREVWKHVDQALEEASDKQREPGWTSKN